MAMSTKLELVDADKGVIEAALEISREWDKNIDRLCRAVLSDDRKTARLLAKELLNDEKGHRIDQGVHRIAGR
jgi:hypothetical protein